MFFYTYNILSIVLLVPVFLFNIYRAYRLGWPLAMFERFGRVPRSSMTVIARRPVILLHAVSVGEIIASRPLLKALRSRYPDHVIVTTHTTETGKSAAAGFSEVDLQLYFPFDFLPAVHSLLSSIKPRVIIIMETEIWPNFCHEAAARTIPLILANGRISDRSYKRYLKFSWFFRPALSCFSAICMQSDVGRERIIAIGATPEVVCVTGNLKNDVAYRQISQQERQQLRVHYAIPVESTVLTAGSTRDGEEGFIVETYRELLLQHSNLFLILAPRHPARCTEVGALLDLAGVPFRKLSELSTNTRMQHGEVLLIDSVGELMNLYALADVAYVGGSLVPLGGHNLLEPASVGIPSLFGPHMANFREIEELVLQYGAGIQVWTQEQLTESCRNLITSVELRSVLGQNGLKLLRDNGGAAQLHLDIIGRYV
ncbi:MAG: 3-deoxy-D-manno-octulosonic acid transferase [Desulfuromonadaceae bacterium]|nr:3-deoxy-D-manno-octulosonic acid transferase [Desulfuromonadaceae bacterium]MDD5104903.1 3-deoxy-D-manno-octulosonic acid transferase [Desulfuromonadaceae bacterium]